MASTPATMLRIVSSGLQDTERLNAPEAQPSIHFYAAVFHRRNRWASRWERIDFDNLADFGRTATVTLPVKGELISRAILVVELPDITTPQINAIKSSADIDGGEKEVFGPFWDWTNGIGHAICSTAEFKIGGTVIDRMDSRLHEVLDEYDNPVEHFDSKNKLILRNPQNYSEFTFPETVQPTDNSRTVEITFPFWWNKGPTPQVLPIQALANDKVQITVQFRSIQECIYTDSRVDPRNPGKEATETGPMPTMAGCGFYQRWPSSEGGQLIYNIVGNPYTVLQLGESPWTPYGRVLPGYQMPTEWHFRDAYWIVEYVSLEDREAAAFRMADLQIPILQHQTVPVVNTNGVQKVRIPLPNTGLVRDMIWVAQREEVTDYNAYFLFSRDIAEQSTIRRPIYPTQIPWWPDAQIPNWDYGDGYIRPAFVNRRSDPITSATLLYRGLPRFDLDGPSFFRSLIPALNCRRTPLIDRYIYRYDFGFWPTGGLAETLNLPEDEVRGFSNWDKIPDKELHLTMNQAPCFMPDMWENAGEPQEFSYNPQQERFTYYLDEYFPEAEAYKIELYGAQPNPRGGQGAFVSGIVVSSTIKKTFGGDSRLILRCIPDGSASVVAQSGSNTYTWVAVAGAGGVGSDTESISGGDAQSAISISLRGDEVESHNASEDGVYGGAGGGRYQEAGVGLPDGVPMPTTADFVFSMQITSGTVNGSRGGDGYYGGGSGTKSGGGGGSYVSRFVTAVNTVSSDYDGESFIRVIPQRRIVPPAQPSFNVYVWLETVNMLRITGGRGALMFN